MNKLEEAILTGTSDAQKRYEAMTGGWWLFHGPELFLQAIIAEKIAELGHAVYVDCSIRRIKTEIGRGPGRPARNEGQRPDISVWYKSTDTLRAVIEVKRASSALHISGDIKKMDRYLIGAGSSSTAYLIVYSEAKRQRGPQTLKKRFDNWSNSTGWKLVGCTIPQIDEGEWQWGAVLLRASKAKVHAVA